MQPKKITDELCVTPQILVDDIEDIAEQGFGKIINNRPDGEQQGQPTSQQLEAEARKHGLEYVYIPIIPGNLDADSICKFGDELSKCEKPTLAFCKTGTRAMMLWALSQTDIDDADFVMKIANQAGYDLEKIRTPLENTCSSRK